jgi:MYXO-CTERM domain-containing protein
MYRGVGQLTLFLTLTVISACQPNSVGDPLIIEQSVHAIRGGSEDLTSTNVVGIVAQAGRGLGMCTGSLIAPNLVLTAQHCVAETFQQVDCANSRFGDVYPSSGFYVTTSAQISRGARYYGVRRIAVPAERAITCGHDIALLILQDHVPSSEAEPLIPRLDELPFRGERFTAVGYGHTGNNEGAGQRRRIENRQVLCAGSECPLITGNQVTAAEFVGDDGTCQGDSGGPALDTEGRVLGALSRGGGVCQSPAYSSVYAWADWIIEIAQEAAEVGRYAPPDWAAPPVIDVDEDGINDVDDNCLEEPNFDQADLDDDGVGDACDDQLDRDCSVCNVCAQHDDCGPGAYCGNNRLCFMECEIDADCPGDGTTVCKAYETYSICVNADYRDRGLCGADFTCIDGRSRESETEQMEEEPRENGELIHVDEPVEIVVLSGASERRAGDSGCSTTPSDTGSPWASTLLLISLAAWRRRRFIAGV